MIEKTARGLYRVRVEAKRTFRDEREAKRFERLARMQMAAAFVDARGGGDSPPIADGMDAWIETQADNGIGEAHLEKCRRVLARFAVELGETLGDIDKQSLRKWRHRRMKSVCAGTANHDISILKAFANWCIEENLWEPDLKASRWLTMKRAEHKRKTPLPVTAKQFSELAGKLPAQIRLPWGMLWCTGDRPGAIYALEWRDVVMPEDTEKGVFGMMTLRKRKGGPNETRQVNFKVDDVIHRILLEARDWFEEFRGRPPRMYDPVFVTARTGGRWDGPTFNSALQWHLDHVLSKKERRRGRIYPYLARHSVASSLARQGLNAYQIAAVTGHRDTRTTETYVHLTGRDADHGRTLVDDEFRVHARWLFEDDEEVENVDGTCEGDSTQVVDV